MRLFIAFAVISVTATPNFAAKPTRIPSDAMSATGRLASARLARLKSKKLSARIGAGACINAPDCEEDEDRDAAVEAANVQSETSIAVDSTGQHVVVGFNDFRGFSNPAVSISGFMYSDDGGNTFADGGQLPTGPTVVIQGARFPEVLGDPDVKYLGGCNFVYVSLLVIPFGSGSAVQTLGIHRSTDCGHTWTGPFEVTTATNPNGLLDTNGNPEDAADKELGDVDPDTGRYQLCWTNFTINALEISCSYSDNVLSAAPTFSPRRVIAATTADGQAATIRSAGKGSQNAYVVWTRFTGGYTNNLGFSRSTDNGVTWSAPINITTDFLTVDQIPGNDRSHVFPAMAVDQNNGAVYVVYETNNARDGADVTFQRSTDSGLTFSPRILLNARPGLDRAQWFPTVTVDQTTGRVWVFFYDQGIASSGHRTQVTYMYSDTGGATWSAPAPLSPTFKAGWENDPNQPNLGDYIQGVAQGVILYASYAETRQPGFADGQPTSSSLTAVDVSVTKVGAGLARPPVRTGAVAITDGADGNIDPGDQIRVRIALENYVTNTLSSAAITGISAALSSATPGVVVNQGSSSYPDLAAGANGQNASEYVVQISAGFVPGTPIDFSLAVTTARGSVTLPLTQQTGTPVYTTLLNETFDGVASGPLPAGWSAAHGAGSNTVPWRTSNAFAPGICGISNKAFHPNANDGPVVGSPSRWERLFSPAFTVPTNAQYVTVEFDVCSDLEDDPVLPFTGYDGVFLRIADLTPGRLTRSVLAEAFEQDFTTGGIEFYPKHLPRNPDPNYFEDLSAWSGYSNGIRHVRMKLPGMQGSTAQLRFEFAQDGAAICSDVRPGHDCGIAIDNVVVRSAVSVVPVSVSLQVAPSLTRAAGTNDVEGTLTITNGGPGTASNVQIGSVSLNGTAGVVTGPSSGSIAPGQSVQATVRFPDTGGVGAGTLGVLRVSGTSNAGNWASNARVTLP